MDCLRQEIQQMKESGSYRAAHTVETAQGAWIFVGGTEVLNLCSNNYLGLANDRRLKEKVVLSLEKYGIGAGGARPIGGTMSVHRELEARIARFKGTEGALVFATGVHANTGTIPALAGQEDVICTDELNHGSIIDGCRLSQARREVYPHKDVRTLKNALERHKSARRRFIVTDGVFSMDGDLAPLPEIVELAERYEAILIVDDAHGEGVLGDHGRGIVDHFRLHGRIDVEVGTLSKAFGVSGGFVCGSSVLVDYLAQRARTFLLSSAPTVPDTAACIEAIDIVEQSDELIKKLWGNTLYFKEGMKDLGFDIGASETPIVPVMCGDAAVAQEYERELFTQGVLARAITYPMVPKDKARLRVMISATHDRTDLDFALNKFAKAKGRISRIH